MSRIGCAVMVALVLGACRQPEEPEDLLDTGWFSDTDDYNPETCTHTFVTVAPDEGTADWYWRDAPTFYTNTDQASWYDARLIDADGVVVSESLDWAETGVSFTLPVEPLKASHTYTLEYTDCRGTSSHTFQTSALGTPLEDGPGDLVRTTWAIDLVGASWIEPGGFAAVLQLYFNVPVLIGVQYADAALIDLIGAPGGVNSDGEIVQDTWEPTWDFPVADFSDQPYFDANTDQVTFDYFGVSIPVYDFRFTATISADGTRLGGGVVSGIGDTRNMGELFESDDDPAAVCDLAATLGVVCEPCPTDSEPYCLYLEARDVDGSAIPGLVLSPSF